MVGDMEKLYLPAAIVLAALILAFTFRHEHVALGQNVVTINKLTGAKQVCFWSTERREWRCL